MLPIYAIYFLHLASVSNSNEFKKSIIKLISRNWWRGSFPTDSTWPHFPSLTIAAFRELIQSSKRDGRRRVVVIEDTDSTLGRELMLHLDGEPPIYRIAYKASQRKVWSAWIEHIDSITRPFLLSIQGDSGILFYSNESRITDVEEAAGQIKKQGRIGGKS